MSKNLNGGTIPGFNSDQSQAIADLAEKMYQQTMQDNILNGNMKHGAVTAAFGLAAKMLAQDAIKHAKKPMPISDVEVLSRAKNELGKGFDQPVLGMSGPTGPAPGGISPPPSTRH